MRCITSKGLAKTVRAASMTYTVRAHDGYARFEAITPDGKWARSQPFIDPAVFFNLRITQKQLEQHMRAGFPWLWEGSYSTSSTAWVTLKEYLVGEKFTFYVVKLTKVVPTLNRPYTRIRCTGGYGINYLIDMPIPEAGELNYPYEFTTFPNKPLRFQVRTTDAAYTVEGRLHVQIVRVSPPKELPENKFLEEEVWSEEVA